jgi:membrane protein
MKKQLLTRPGMAKTISQFWQHGVHRTSELNQRTHGWLGVVTGAIRQTFFKPESGISAAAISYYSLFSLFPITLLSISIASFYLGPMSQQFIIRRLEFIAPAMGQLLGKTIDEVIQTRGTVSLIALLSLVWSGSRIFDTLNQTLYLIWTNKRRRPVWKQRGLSILFVLAFAGPALFLASVLGSISGHISVSVPEQFNLLARYVSFIVAFLLDIALLMLLYILLPHGSSTWHEILPGAIAAGLFWELAKKAFLLFVSSYVSVSNLVYGSVATIIAFLVWAYLSGLIFIFGAYLSVFYNQRRVMITEEADKRKTEIVAKDEATR